MKKIFKILFGSNIDKKVKSAKSEYNNENIEVIEYNDERFGKILIEHDTNKNQISGEIKNINFDGDLLYASFFMMSDNLNIEIIISNLKKFCDSAKIFKEKMYNDFSNYLKGGDNFDKDGNLIEISEQFLKENFKFNCFNIIDNETIGLWGQWENSGNQDYSINYNVNTQKIQYELL